MTDILKTLGDNWHTGHPYLDLIEEVLPNCPHAVSLEKKLLEVYTEQENGFKLYKNSSNVTIFTIFDSEIDILIAKKKNLEEERKKEDERFNKLLEKFKEQETPESIDEKEEEEDEDEEVVVKQKGKGQQACRRTLKKEHDRKKSLVNNVKSSMASSQMKLMELGEEIDKLEKMTEYYTHYRNASRNYALGTKRVVLQYSETKDIAALIQGLSELISYYEHMMRRYVPSQPCEGKEKGLCGTHMLPLSLAVYPNENYKHVWKCAVSP